MTKFKNKVVWITGASSGIGEALAIELSRQGAKLIISARRKEELDRVKNLCKTPAEVATLPLDLTFTDTMHLAVETALLAFGHVDILINNGGVSQRSLAKDTKLEVDKKLMEVNYFGTIALTKALLPHFLERKAGQIAVVSSLVGKFGTPYRSGYAASKHALHGFFDALRAELWKDNITVTILCPGFIKTNVSVNALTESGEKLNQMDDAQANGMSAAKCAKKMAKAIRRQKNEVYIGGKEIYGVYLKRFFPGLFARVVRKAQVR
ncbi:SDR family oxidoreductase [Fulvivirga sp. RKSG066]|uniref:SDR family oxidoreductase n=1 Tax=Fulvivirga aurantia TaxID=2529383 RepID=UPI0012BBDE83|nr:SDR family oxidoreductase [Fulvivirga aurantia]MTI21517.1 SDR family oxidoreductase [Fulvivirga aurantia]